MERDHVAGRIGFLSASEKKICENPSPLFLSKEKTTSNRKPLEINVIPVSRITFKRCGDHRSRKDIWYQRKDQEV